MRPHFAPRTGFWGAVTALVALVACSGGGNGPRAAAPDLGPAGATTTTEPTFSGLGGERLCAHLKAANEQLGTLLLSQPTPENAERLVTSAASSVSAAVDVAPPEIVADVRVMAAAYADLVSSLRRVGWDMTRLPDDAQRRLSTGENGVAASRLAVYQTRVCR